MYSDRRYFAIINSKGSPTKIGDLGQKIRDDVSSNLKQLRLITGLDYRGFNISGVPVDQRKSMDLDFVCDELAILYPDLNLKKLRLIVSETPVHEITENQSIGLLLNISYGGRLEWKRDRGPIAADIKIDSSSETQHSSIITDIFQDIMIANQPSIQCILQKYLTLDGNHELFFQEKAKFSKEFNEIATKYQEFDPTKYISFSAAIRTQYNPRHSPQELERLGTIWTSFLVNRFSRHFLTTAEAIDFIKRHLFRETRTFKRVKLGNLATKHLQLVLNDQSIVTQPGCYVLCVKRRKPSVANRGHVDAFFKGYRGPPNLALIPQRDYSRKIQGFVGKGYVLPVTLFLSGRP